MNGNRTWAAAQGLPPVAGHVAGRAKLKEVIRWSLEDRLQVLTVYAFSSENWKRPPQQVAALMALLGQVLDEDVTELHQQGVRIRIVGRREGLEYALVDQMAKAEGLTASNQRMLLQVCFNYGAVDDVVSAVQQIVAKGVNPQQVSWQLIRQHLWTAGSPYPDLVLRTGGEHRLSNFLSLEAGYAELAFTKTLWPDLTREEYLGILAEVAKRPRKFGR